MPDWTFTFYGDTMASNDDWINISIPPVSQVQQEYEEYVRECEQQDREIERKLQEQAELEEDKKKYPLFFLKEGII